MRVDYATYINSRLWHRRRRAFISAATGRCQICGEQRYSLDVHHLHYRTLGHESAADVLVLCRHCHDVVHYGGVIKRALYCLGPACESYREGGICRSLDGTWEGEASRLEPCQNDDGALLLGDNP